jgi:hypothetical protein
MTTRPDCLRDAHTIADAILADLKATNPDPEALKEACRHEMGQLLIAAGVLAESAFPAFVEAKALYVQALKKHLARMTKPRASKNR